MESFVALLTAILCSLFLWHVIRTARARAREHTGALLGRWSGNWSRRGWILAVMFGAVMILGSTAQIFQCLGRDRGPDLLPDALFQWTLFVICANPLSLRLMRVVEFREAGILPSRAFYAWESISYCAWGQVPGELLIHTRNRWPVIHRVWLPRRDVDEATAILCRCVRVRDAWNRVLNPEFRPPARPDTPITASVEFQYRHRPFQFDLRTLLFFVLVASCAMSWYGIRYRRERQQTDQLAKLERFTPTAFWFEGAVRHLDFSASPIKPGDEDLEIVAKLPRLELLDLTGAPVTDAGLVRLEKMTSLRYVFLAQTRVTKEGVNRLQRALPQATICH
ncbi:MAG: hypothetical protein ACLQLG_16375 [Thermoguttaceae bacterium]